jgi:hypothetical protein
MFKKHYIPFLWVNIMGMPKEEIKHLIKGFTEKGMTDKKEILKEIKGMKYPTDVLKQTKDVLKDMDISIKKNDKKESSEKSTFSEKLKKEKDNNTEFWKSFQKQQQTFVKSQEESEEVLKNFSKNFLKEINTNYDAMGYYLGNVLHDDNKELAAVFREEMAESVLNKMGLNSDDFESTEDILNIVNKHMDRFVNNNASFNEQMRHSISRFFETKAGEHLKTGIQNAMSTIQGHVDTVLGETKTLLIDPIMNVGKTAFNMIMDTQGDEGDEETHTLLDSIFNKLDDMHDLNAKMFGLDKKEFLKNQRDKGKGSKSMFGDLFKDLTPISLMIVGLGLTLGALTKALVYPFEILMKLTGLLKPFASIVSKIKNFISPLLEGVSVLATKIPLLGKFIKAFSVGFKFLGWPLTILLGVVDFFKGFIGSSETTFMGKLTDGIKEVFTGFLDIPIKIFGWMVDKTLSLFGIEFETKTSTIITKGLNFLLDYLLSPIKSLSSIFSDVGNVFSDIFSIIKDVFSIAYAIFSPLWGDFSNLKNILPLFKDIGSKIFDAIITMITMIPKYFLTMIENQFKNLGELIGVDLTKPIEKIKTGLVKTFVGFFDWLLQIPMKIKDLILKNPITKLAIKLLPSSESTVTSTVPSMATGGITLKEGLVNIHPNEIVGPVTTVIPQLVKEVMTNKSTKSVDKVIEKIIPQTSSGNTTVINNNTTEKQMPPTDVESLSLFVFNSTWGFS